MDQLSIAELERRCQKPDHRRVGNWMARRITRPAALRMTRLAAPLGVTAHAATLGAWGVGLGAAAALAWGTPCGWLLGAAMLQLWYLLDHVDGQLARLRGTASLDGAQLDYLMHHTLNLLVPVGAGWGLFVARAEPLWAAAGLIWGVATMAITLRHDARYKAFVQRLKRLRGRLEVVGGGGARPAPQPPLPRNPVRLAARLGRKACEVHVVMNLAAAIAVVQLLTRDRGLLLAGIYLAAMAPLSAGVAAWDIVRSQRRLEAEHEFAAWYRVPAGKEMTFRDGWWITQDTQDGQCSEGSHGPA